MNSLVERIVDLLETSKPASARLVARPTVQPPKLAESKIKASESYQKDEARNNKDQEKAETTSNINNKEQDKAEATNSFGATKQDEVETKSAEEIPVHQGEVDQSAPVEPPHPDHARISDSSSTILYPKNIAETNIQQADNSNTFNTGVFPLLLRSSLWCLPSYPTAA